MNISQNSTIFTEILTSPIRSVGEITNFAHIQPIDRATIPCSEIMKNVLSFSEMHG